MSRIASEGAPLVSARNVHKSFGHNEVLKGIDLDVMPGEVVVVLGPSGSGKSTFLRCINHLEAIDRGSIMVAGEQIGYRLNGERLVKLSPRAIAAQRRQIGMVFQQFNLYPHMTALENIIEAPVGVHGHGRKEATDYAMELLARIGLTEKANAYPR
ncbi:ATP-binding cassette domain-containing protein, partial [Bosea sp. (in: a-proteobacteria)]|uniref:amino acid ABC transporter ATP-binding protein n=1 Tax=Bosea sp. (in: a-proteobacteria) TaxID=1871050 RepID=UPI0025C14346